MDPFVDGSVNPNVKVHQWLAQWQDMSDDVVVYTLRYRSRYSGTERVIQDPDNDQLAVSVAWIPALQAKAKMSVETPTVGK
jgi:hypothetical protein